MLGETIDDDKINISNLSMSNLQESSVIIKVSNFLVSIACLDNLSLLG